MKDEAIIKRFKEELIAHGITERGPISWAEASRAAKWPAGKRAGKSLGFTYIRDIVRTGRGAFEGMELLCKAWNMDWDYVKTGRRQKAPLLLEGPSPHMDAAPIKRSASADEDAFLLETVESALRLVGTAQHVAAGVAQTVLSILQARRSGG